MSQQNVNRLRTLYEGGTGGIEDKLASDFGAPDAPPEAIPLRPAARGAIRRRDRLGGLIHEYAWAA